MKIRRFRGKSLPEVMLKIKEALGEDAVILSTKKDGNVVEVLAAADLNIDEEPRKQIDIVETIKKAPPNITITDWDPKDVGRILVELEELKRLVSLHIQKHNETKELKKELSLIKDLLASSPQITPPMDQETASIFKRLKEMEIDDKIIATVMQEISKEELLSPAAVCEETLKKVIRTSRLQYTRGKPVIFAGPTGVGKTTTVAKIASIMRLHEGLDVAMISIDTFRVGASDQLQIYAEVLGIDLFVANTPDEFKKLVELLKDVILLVDTAGRSPKDSLRKEEMDSFLKAIDQYTLLVAIPYNSRTREAINIVENFSTKRPDGIILTKLDEAEVFGLPVNLCWHMDIPITYITTGQRVPEDIEEASPEKMVKYILEEEGR